MLWQITSLIMFWATLKYSHEDLEDDRWNDEADRLLLHFFFLPENLMY